MFPWFLCDVFGIHITLNTYFIILIALLLLSWLISLLSKIIFKQFFSNVWWETLFAIIVGFTTAMEVYIGSLFNLSYFGVDESFLEYTPIFSITFDLLFPMLIFFIAYLIHFVMRLVRYKKEKAALLAQK